MGILMGISDWSPGALWKASRNERMKSASAWRWTPTRAT